MNLKKIMATVVALAMVLSSMGMVASAEVATVAKIGDTPYATLADAIEKATAGDEIVLLKDVEVTARVVIEKSITIDGNGYSIITSSDRGIEIPAAANGADVTLKNLTVTPKNGWFERGINYNTTGKLTLDKVTVSGATYALNMPGKAIGAEVEITDSDLSGCIALNVWGKNATINVTDTALTSVDNTSVENYCAVKLNNDGITAAEGAIITITGGSITALDENEEASDAVINATSTGQIIVSDTTTVNGATKDGGPVVVHHGESSYTYDTLQEAAAKAAGDNTVTGIKIIKPIVISEDTTIDLKGLTFEAVENAFPAIRIINGATLTISNGTINNPTGYVFILGASDGSSVGNLVINSGTYKGLTTVASVTKGTLTVNGGKFEVYEGKFGTTYMLNCIDSNYKAGQAKIQVNGGTFVGFNPQDNAAEGNNTVFTAEGYKATVDADGNYVVSTSTILKDAADSKAQASGLMSFTGETSGIKWCSYKFVVDMTGKTSIGVTVEKDGAQTKSDNKTEWVNTANIESDVAFGVAVTGLASLDTITVDVQ